MIHPRRIVWLVLFGATIGAFLDWTHTHGDEIRYPPDTNHWRGILTFALVYSIPAYLAAWFVEAAGTTVPPVGYRAGVLLTCLYVAAYLVTAYGDTWLGLPSTQTAVLVYGLGLAVWSAADGSWQGLVAAIGISVMGGLVEHVLCSYGRMSYRVQELGTLPYWLPGIYFLGPTTYGHLSRRVLVTQDAIMQAPRL